MKGLIKRIAGGGQQKTTFGGMSRIHESLSALVQNILFEYKFNAFHRGMVPIDDVEKLMKLYGGFVAQKILAELGLKLEGKAAENFAKELKDHEFKRGGYFNPEQKK